MTEVLDTRDRRPPPRPPSRRRPVRWLAVLFVLLLVAGLAFGAVYAGQRVLTLFESAPDYGGEGTGEVVVQVMPGETVADVATTLRESDVIASRQAFLEVANPDPRSSTLQPGFYRLVQQVPAVTALDLLFDPTAKVVGRVTVPEGLTVPEILETLSRGIELPLADLEAAAADPAALDLPDYADGRLEGFLFPATYDIDPGTSAVDVLRLLVSRFSQAAQETGLDAGAAELGLTPYEVVITASLIERESRVDEELAQVSRVVYNRLDQGIPLGIDAAVLYGLGRTSGGLTQSDLAEDTPYNNRINTGLPPTPIAAPGESALRAALEPDDGDWLYYVLAERDGRHLFTSDYDEFLRQKAESQREGIF